MVQLIKKHRSKAAELVGAALFVLLMFFNLQIATNPNSNGDIDLFGLKISLFAPSVYATGGVCPSCPYQYEIRINPSNTCPSGYWYNCWTYGHECQTSVSGCA
ncbi:hypothetical protein ABRY23_06015 [Melioribacteraceae bacterium 4301-Me]|uniref:hypothetical protein n=1 Tax=Pyranulibacter aquaticus TaxID=3163344 RepID=UPI003599467A